MKRMKRILAILTVLAMVVTSVPNNFWATAYADADSPDTRVADNTTLNSWQQYFGTDDDSFTTQYSGHVWTDKSVTVNAGEFGYATELADRGDKITINSEDENNFLVSLSAMASSKSVTGQDNKPTDTMIVLDLSSSMYNGSNRTTAAVKAMIDSVNNTIAQLQKLNVNNRVGVTIYYGGVDRNQSTAPSYKLLLPLDRYVHSSDKYLRYTTSSGKLQTVGVNTNVKTEKGTAVSGSRTVTDVAGTYTQQGILSALQQFLKADTTVPQTAAVNAGETRIPVMVLMSDGEPTAATHKYTDINANAGMGNNTVSLRYPDQTDFVTQLTASYAKEMMDAHYEEEPIFYTLSLGTSISYDVMDPSDTLGKNFTPSATISGYWDKLIANGSVAITVKNSPNGWSDATVTKNYTVSKTTVTGKTLSKNQNFPYNKEQQMYVDKAFEAATAGDLEKAFADIFTDITLQTHTYPTLVEGDDDLDGYISFVDKVGQYMNVTDVKGILLGTTWYSGKELAKNFVSGGGVLGTAANPTELGNELVWSIQQRMGLSEVATARTLLSLAHQHGQMDYDSSTGEYSNYVGWYSDINGNYLGFWQEGVTSTPDGAAFKNKSYLYLGETDAFSGVKDSDMMYTIVRVRENIATGEQSVTFAVPAALIPIVEYDVELDENDTLTSVTRGGADNPIRLVYEVALNDAINEITLLDSNVVDSEYIEANTNSDGSVNFYTNQYETDGSVGYGKVNTYSYFRPSHQNENYYYQENETVYADEKGNAYVDKNSAPDPDGTYYREITVYTNSDGKAGVQTIYRQLSASALETAVPRADGTWYIPKGNVHVNMDGYTSVKSENKTGTLPNVSDPYVDVYGHNVNDTDHRFVMGDTLGNNGKVKLVPATGLKIRKVVEGTEITDETFEFVITAAAEVKGDFSAVKVAADGTETAETVTFANSKATVTLKAGECIYITGLDADADFEITESEEAGFILSGVKVDGNAVTGTAANVTTTANKITETDFTNVPRGEGTLTIAKQVVHPMGTGYQIPEDKTFTVNVKLEGIAVNSGDEFEVIHSSDTELTTVKAGVDKSFDLTLKDGEQVEITGIPEGTKATVTEKNPGSGFTVTYKENTVAGDGVIESVQKVPTIDAVTVVNTYKPEPAQVKIDLSGVKTLIDAADKTIAKENWGDLEFEFIIQKYVLENGTWQWVDTESADTADKTDDTIDFVSGGRVLTFDNVGTYGYQVIEKNHGLTVDGITYDATMHTFDVIVTDADMDGQLEAEVKSSHGDSTNFVFTNGVWTNDQINFVNRNDRGHTSQLLMIKKELENESGSTAVSLEGYQFELFESNSDYTETGDKVLTTEKTDAAGETYLSLEYDYEDAGTYYYILKEKSTEIPGMTDSSAVYNIRVIVTADNNGLVTSTIVAEGEKEFGTYESAVPGVTYNLATFKNIYNPTEATVELDVTKKLDGRALSGGEFEFRLMKDNAVVETVSNNADGSVDFSVLTFDKVGTYEYTVSEVTEGNKNLEVDGTVYDVVITVADSNGKLEASVEVPTVPGNAMVFENRHIPEPVTVKLEGDKELRGKELISGQFAFELKECDADGNVKAGGHQQTVTNGKDGHFGFEEISYDKEGTYYYLISEVIPENTQGITYDKTVYLAKINVNYDDESGTFLVADAMSILNGEPAYDGIKFENTYKADAITTDIPGFKSLNGRNLEDGQFEFKLYEADASWTKGAELQAVRNAADGTFGFGFDEDYFEEAGTYYYIIDEADAGAAGYTYDDKEVGVKIEITDDMIGSLHVTKSYADLERAADGTVTETETAVVRFDNDYTVTGEAKVHLSGTKTLDGRDLKADEFTFVLTDVTDKDNPVETATAQNDADGKFEFGLTYGPADVGSEYTYILTEKAGADNVGITYDDEEFKIIVKVADDGKGGIATDVEIKDGLLNLFNADAIAFENDYNTNSAKLTLEADKVLTGMEMEAGDFEFQLMEGGSVLQTKTNDADGNIVFDEITYDAAGTHTYTIKEVIPADKNEGMTYDEDVLSVTVDVIDNGVGQLVAKVSDKEVTAVDAGDFENSYKTYGEFDFPVTKQFTGRSGDAWLDTDAFQFEVVVLDAATQQAVADGDIDLQENVVLTIDEKDEVVRTPMIKVHKAGTYKFRVHEVTANPIPGVVYDGQPRDIIATAADDGNGKLNISWTEENGNVVDVNGEQGLRFVNKYDTTITELYGHDDLVVDKTFAGRQGNEWLDTDAFTFVLAAADDTTKDAVAAGSVELPETTLIVTKNNNAHSHFGNIVFHKAGTYTFTVTEQSSNLPGVTDDPDSVRTVTIEVADNGVGQLVVANKTVTKSGEGGNAVESDLNFTNVYKTGEVQVTLEASKKLEAPAEMYDRVLDADEFTFELKDEEGKAVDTAKNHEGGLIEFDAITYKNPGTYKYTINEVIPADAEKLGGVTYDETVYNVTVEVVDNNDGTLTAKAPVYTKVGEDTAGAAKFVNTYKADSVTVDFEGTKSLTGRDLAAGEFEFQLKDADGKVVEAVKNSADGKIDFAPVKYTAKGTYKYTISEMIPADAEKLGGVTYDESVFEVIVTVTDNKQGQLVAETVYKNGGETVTAVAFNNTYKPEPISVDISGGKQLAGRDLTAGEFEFQLKDGDAVLQTAAVGENGIFEFAPIEYTAAGTHEYTVSEVKGDLKGVTYDENVFAVKVVVTDNGNGTLSKDVSFNVNGENIGAVNFYNDYTPEPVKVDLEASKILEGRDWFDSDEFEFELKAEGDTKQAVKDGIVTMPAKTATADKDSPTAVFGNIEITKAGVYNFAITEKAGDLENVTYDTHVLHAVVTVVDDAEAGALKLKDAVSYIGGTEFVNNYTPDSITVDIEGTKVLTGRDLAADEFEFELTAVTEGAPMPSAGTAVKNAADGSVDFGTITYSKAGTYEYRIVEKSGDLPGITYDSGVISVIVNVTYDKATGLLSAETSYDGEADGFVFENEYNTVPAEVTLSADKTVVSSEGNAYDLKAGDFKFLVTAADSNPGAIAEPFEVSNNADGSIDLGAFSFAEAGEYTYTVKEVSGSIPGMSYDDAVYTITVKVTDDESEAQLKAAVSITENGKAADAIAFENKYNPAETSIVIDGVKTLDSNHRELAEGDFSFELKDAEGNVIDAAQNTASGTFQFGALTYDKVGTYEYTVSEVNDGKAGYTYDDAVYTVTVKVTDENGALKAAVTGGTAETIVFTNGYEPAAAELVIKGHKALEGRDLNEGEFGFAVMDGDKEIASAVNGKDGSFAFGALNFTEAGTYNYTIVEKNTNVAGVTYDQIVYGVTVKVVDENGALKVDSVEYLQNGSTVDALTFNNSYKPAPTGIQLGAVKVLEGRDLTEGEFTFVLEDADGNKLTAVNTADGKVIFDEIAYDAAGTYTYKMYEAAGDDKEITYDETVYNITVTVSDDLNGNLKAEIEGLAEGAVFKNTYVPEEEPTEPTDPTEPEEPTEPSEPEEPTQPPTEPEEPTDSEEPTQPPTEPTQPMDETYDGGTQTGDDFNGGLYGFLALAALAVAGAAFRRRKAE